MRAFLAFAAVTSLILTVMGGCDDDGAAPGPGPAPNYSYELQEAFPNLRFVRPVDIQNAGDGSDRLFVVEKRGIVRLFANEDSVASTKTFLDISGKVKSSGSEQGLLGLAFHPNYRTNGYFFVYYTIASNENRLSRFQVSAGNPDSTDQSSEAVLLEFPKAGANTNHNGGQIAFGEDGYLYVSVGDGGGGGDPDDNGQDLTTLLGAILRLDVDSQALGNYGIPPTNPFAFSIKNYRPEIYAYGLRNTWRFSFDPVTDWLWAGDVGQGTWEEINVIEMGGNYGWDCYEGAHELASKPLCDTLQVNIDPIHEYAHADGNVSVTGGRVYRGPSLSSLVGVYVFADYNSGRIWTIRYDGSDVSPADLLLDAPFRVSAFGVDEAKELYLCEYSTGGSETQLYKLKQVAD
jgi:glucose/arabinose dehydrogenase